MPLCFSFLNNAHNRQASLLSKYCGFIRDDVLLPPDAHRASGLSFHLADVLLPEVEAFALRQAQQQGRPGAGVPGSALRALLEPFCRMLEATPDLPVVTRIRSALFEPLVEQLARPSARGADGEEAVDHLRHLDAAALAADLFAMGAKPETLYRNRTALYELSAALERAAAKRQRRLDNKAGGSASGRGEQPVGSASVTEAAADLFSPGARDGVEEKRKKKKRKAVACEEHGPLAAGTSADAPAAVGRGHDRAAAADGPSARPDQAATGGPSSKKAKLVSTLSAADVAQQKPTPVAKVQLVSASGAAMPRSAMKGARKRQSEELAVAAAAPSSTSSTPLTASKREALAKVANHGRQTAGGGSKGSAPGSALNPSGGARKKQVKINLKQNLYHAFGGPVPPPEVRTPVRQTVRIGREGGGINLVQSLSEATFTKILPRRL